MSYVLSVISIVITSKVVISKVITSIVAVSYAVTFTGTVNNRCIHGQKATCNGKIMLDIGLMSLLPSITARTPWSTNCRGWLSTVDLLIKIGCFVTKKK